MNFIKVYKNQFSASLCDDLIQLFEDCDISGNTHAGDSGKRNVDVQLKDSIDLDMGPKSIPNMDLELLQRIETSICVPILNYLNTCVPSKDGELNYLDLNYTRRAFGFLQPPKLKRYRSPNEGYHAWHQDWGFLPAQVRRMLVVMAYLNDVEDGGEPAFFHLDLKIKPEAPRFAT